MVMFIMLHKIVLTFELAEEILKMANSNESYLIETVVLTFDSVDEISKCDHSNGSYRAALSRGAVYYAA